MGNLPKAAQRPRQAQATVTEKNDERYSARADEAEGRFQTKSGVSGDQTELAYKLAWAQRMVAAGSLTKAE